MITSGSDSVGVRYSIRRARSPGPKRRVAGCAVAPGAAAYLGLTFCQADGGKQANLGLIADRQALGDEDRAAQSAAERAADGDLEGAEDGTGHALPDVSLVDWIDGPANERRVGADPSDLGVPLNFNSCGLREPEPRRRWIHGRPEGRGDTRQRLAEQQLRPRQGFDRMGAAALQADGLDVFQREPAQPPAIPAERDGRLDDLPWLPSELKVPIGRVHDPDLARGSDTVADSRRPSSPKNEDRVGLVDDGELGCQVLASYERDEDRTYRPVQREGGLRCRFGRPHPHGTALHGAGLAVRGDLPPRDTIRRVADGWRQRMDALAVGIERDARLRLAPDPGAGVVACRTCRLGQVEAPGSLLGFGRLDHVARQRDSVEVGIRLGQPIEQVERAINDVVGVVAAIEKEPLGWFVQL